MGHSVDRQPLLNVSWDNPGHDADEGVPGTVGAAGNHESRLEGFSAVPSWLQRVRSSRRASRINNPPQHYEKKTLGPDELHRKLEAALPFCELAEAIGSGRVPESWEPVAAFNGALRDKLCQDPRWRVKIRVENGIIKDGVSGFSAQVFAHKDKSTNEYALVFGSSGEGWNAPGPADLIAAPFRVLDALLGKSILLARAISGRSMVSYHLAEVTAKELQRLLGEALPNGSYKLTLTGQGQGGGDAQFAALHATPALPAKVFGSVQHCPDGFRNVSSRTLDDSKALIEQYSVRGDLIPAVRGHIRGNDGLGTGYHIDGNVNKNLFHKHQSIAEHLRFEIQRLRLEIERSSSAFRASTSPPRATVDRRE